MYRFRARDLNCHQDVREIQITIGVAARANADALIRNQGMQRIFIRLRVHGDALDAQLAARSDDTARDFAAIRNKNFLKHQ